MNESLPRFPGGITEPSVWDITYQARSLVAELLAIDEPEYPREACNLRDVIISIADFVADELANLATKLESVNDENDLYRAKQLASAIHKLCFLEQFLRESSPSHTPPEIQEALSYLTNLYLSTTGPRPICLVARQWKYNLTYKAVTWELMDIIPPQVLDPRKRLGIEEPEQILPALWKQWIEKTGRSEPDNMAPKHIGILSFPKLDTQNTLLYPLLAHELGHFIDFSQEPALHERLTKKIGGFITDQEVERALQKSGSSADPALYKSLLVKRTFVCIRELIADLLAARMLGLSFFFAQAEFLKTLTPWKENKITSTGYPGLKFRLSTTFNHLMREDCRGNPRKLLAGVPRGEEADWLRDNLDDWSEKLKSNAQDVEATNELDRLADKAVQSVLEDLHSMVAEKYTQCSELTPCVFERIACLTHRIPPHIKGDTPACIAEIMTASWVYELLTLE